MTVAHILSTKGPEVVTIQPHRTLAEAAQVLAERRIGSVLVTGADRAILGILSERDIVRVIAKEGAGALNEAVSRFMTTRVVTCTPKADINEIMETMTTGKFRHVPILDEGRLAGIVSIGDVVKHRLHEIESEHQALREYIATA
jgi:CBS domain-containing protein